MATLLLSTLIIRVKVELSASFNVIKSFAGLIPWLHSIGLAALENIMVHLFSVVLLKLGHSKVTEIGISLSQVPTRPTFFPGVFYF